MAEEESDLTLEEEQGKGSNKMMLIIIIVAVVVIGAGAAFFLLSGDDEAPEVEGEQTTEETVAEAGPSQPAEIGSAKYVTMPRPFTFNVPGTTRDRLVQIRVQLMVRGDNNQELAQKHIPLIEGTLLKAFSTATADDLATTAGKDALKLKAAKDVQKAVIEITGSKIVEEVLFTGFVMQ